MGSGMTPHGSHRLARGRTTPAAADAWSRMRPDDVHVWALRLDLGPTARERLEAFLSADELSRAARFVRSTDRSRYVCAHGLLRLVLSKYLNLQPEEVAFETGAGGKPRLAGPGPRFNLAHAEDVGVVAVTAYREVGIDVERIRDVGDVGRLAESCFSPAEQAALGAVAAPFRLRSFFAGWTRKEAFLKALGTGLMRPLDSFDVTLTPGEPARLLRVQGAPKAATTYALRALRPAPGYAGAVAADGAGIVIHWRPWDIAAALVKEARGAGRVAPRAWGQPADRLPCPRAGGHERARRVRSALRIAHCADGRESHDFVCV